MRGFISRPPSLSVGAHKRHGLREPAGSSGLWSLIRGSLRAGRRVLSRARRWREDDERREARGSVLRRLILALSKIRPPSARWRR